MSKQVVMMKRGDGEQMNVLGVRLRFLCAADKTEHAWSMMETILPRHSGPPAHEHPWDEAYYVVEGEVRFEVDGRVELLKAGDFIYAPGGTVHAFQGASEHPARVLIFDAPAHAESFFRELDREVRDMPRDLAKLPEIGARHDVHFMGA